MDLQTIDTYNNAAKAYADKFNNIGPRIEDIERGITFTGLVDPHVVEIGCGNGRDAKEIIARTPHYLGIDASSKMIDLAREMNSGATFAVEDMLTSTVPEGTDLIFAFASFLHVSKEDLRHCFQTYHSSLKPKGVIYLSVKEGTYQKFIKTDEYGDRIFFLYDEETIRSVAEHLFEVIYIDHQTILGVNWLTMALRKL